jgi:rSAM/selenodomain-associated transferase 1
VHYKKLGIFSKTPVPGEVKTGLVPPLTPDEACGLYKAFLVDLFDRVSKLKKLGVTVFHSGSDPAAIQRLVPDRYALVPQEGDTPGERLENAFRVLLHDAASFACVVGSDTPDLPLVYVKRAYVKLKHRDVVLGPTLDGGCYLIGLKKLVPGLFENVAWGGATVLFDTLRNVESEELSCALLPPWYDVDTPETLSLLRTMLLARRIERRDRLHRVEKVIESLPWTRR